MVEETENIVLALLRELRKEQSVLLGSVDHMRRMADDVRRLTDDVRKMEQRLDDRLIAVRDDLELMLKSELLGRLTHFETMIEEKLERLSDRVSALEA